MNDRLNELEKDIADKTGLTVEEVHTRDENTAEIYGTTPEAVAEAVDEAVNAGENVTGPADDDAELLEEIEEMIDELEDDCGDED